MKTIVDKLTAAVEIINNFEGIEISDINEALHTIFPETTFSVRELPPQPERGQEGKSCENWFDDDDRQPVPPGKEKSSRILQGPIVPERE